MRRVFPLRPSETSLLVSYHNGAYELDAAEPDVSSSSSSCNLKGSSSIPLGLHRRRSSTNFSVTFRDEDNNKDSPALQHKTSQESAASAYPEFVEPASPSPRSSLWTCSFRDDGDSTSFNLSDGTHHGATSSVSSSSSSSITYNPRGSASFSAIPSNKIVHAPPDTASSTCEDVNSLIGTKTASCKDSKSCLVESPTATVASIKSPSQPLQIPNPQVSSQPSTHIHDAPRKVQESMHVHGDAPTGHRLSHCSVSSPKVAARSLETSTNCSCLPRSRESWSAPRSTSVSSKSYSCGTAFKCLTKCLRTEKSRKNLQKERSISFRVSSPVKFSTNLNQLYSPMSPAQDISSSKGRAEGETEYIRKEISTVKDFLPSSPSLRDQVHANGGCETAEDDWHLPLKCQSFGANMITDYMQHVRDVAKSSSFRKARESSSLHYDSDSVSSKEFKRSSSRDFTLKPGKASSKRSYNVTPNGNHVDCKDRDRPPDLCAAEEKNTKNLALLRLEISKLCKDKRLLTRELAAEMKARQCEQKVANNAIKNMETAMEEKLISAEKDHTYVQACLEKEIDRRKKDWSAKLDKIRLEEKKLRERVTEMALERVELQKSIASYKGREASLQTQAQNHEVSAQAWMRRHRQSEEEALLLRQSFTTVCNKLSDKEHELDLVLQRSKVLERENADLLKEFSRLRRVYADQDSTFEELWQWLLDIVNGASDDKVESLRRLHSELKVFSVREQALRYEIGVLQSQLFHTKQKNGPDTEDCFSRQEGSRLCSPKEHTNFLKKLSVQQKKGASLESLDDLVKKLESAKQHVRRAEHQLEVKEEEVALLHSTLKERDHAMKDLQDEFLLVKAQRDGLRKQVQQMGHEALSLTLELSELRKVVEKMEDELMLKEGQIAILRDTCSDSDF